MARETEFSIKQSADSVARLINEGRTTEAVELLELQRRDKPLVVQEALDRYVASGASERLEALRQTGESVAADLSSIAPALARLRSGFSAPRFPESQEIDALPSEAQRYDVYVSIVATRGDLTARDALARGDRVILGLRQENSTLASLDNPRTQEDESRTLSGKGVYDDGLVVLWRDAAGNGSFERFDHANTEPTAQYDHHAGSNGRRTFSDGGREEHRVDPSPGFESVRAPRKIEGEDVDGDGIRDLGRLAEGTVEMQETTHPNPGTGRREFSLRPTDEAIAPGRNAGRVERDTNADGWFTNADINGRQELNNSFKIHRGSWNSTDSAGCQTIRGEDYTRFTEVVRGNPQQTRWQYVLTSTTPGMLRNLNQERNPEDDRREQGQQQRPHHQQPRQEHPRGHDENAPAMPGEEPPRQPDPRNPRHPDHPLYQAAFDRMREANVRQGVGLDDMGMQQAALSLLVRAKQDPLIRRIDEVRFSDATPRHAAGHAIVALYRPFGDKEPAFGVHMETQAAARMPVEQSLQTLAETSRQQGQPHGQQAMGQSNEHEAARRMT
jgi:type IV secretion system effector X-Tfes-like protein